MQAEQDHSVRTGTEGGAPSHDGKRANTNSSLQVEEAEAAVASAGEERRHQLCESEEHPLVRSMLIAFMVMFQGYGCMVGNPQHLLKKHIGIHDYDSENAKRFTLATNLFQWGKCGTRILQIAFLVVLEPRGLVMLSYCLMSLALLIPPVFIFAAGVTESWFVFVAATYITAGVAVGIFEATFLSVTSALGKSTKLFTIMGAPIGFAMLNIVWGTILNSDMGTWVGQLYYYYAVACLPVGVMIFQRKAPRGSTNSDGKGCAVFIRSMSMAKHWLPPMVPCLLAKLVGNFVLENTFPLTYNVYNTEKVPFFGGPGSDAGLIPKSYYLSLYFFVMMAIGDTVSRRVPLYIDTSSYWKTQFLFLGAFLMCVAGEAMLFLITPIVTGLGTFVALFGQGFIYGLSAKYIDSFVPREHSYTAYMLWCFAGDIGGIIGSSVIVNEMVALICNGRNFKYVCHSKEKAVASFLTFVSNLVFA